MSVTVSAPLAVIVATVESEAVTVPDPVTGVTATAPLAVITGTVESGTVEASVGVTGSPLLAEVSSSVRAVAVKTTRAFPAPRVVRPVLVLPPTASAGSAVTVSAGEATATIRALRIPNTPASVTPAQGAVSTTVNTVGKEVTGEAPMAVVSSTVEQPTGFAGFSDLIELESEMFLGAEFDGGMNATITLESEMFKISSFTTNLVEVQ